MGVPKNGVPKYGGGPLMGSPNLGVLKGTVQHFGVFKAQSS